MLINTPSLLPFYVATNNIMDYSRVKSKNEKSLCEKSMNVVVNIIRLSSFSIAQRTLGTTARKSGNKEENLDHFGDNKEPEMEKMVSNQFPASSRRSQQPQSRVNPTYVTKSVGSNRSTEYMIHKERLHHHHHHVNSNKELCVDGLASDYISKIRNKLGRTS